MLTYCPVMISPDSPNPGYILCLIGNVRPFCTAPCFVQKTVRGICESGDGLQRLRMNVFDDTPKHLQFWLSGKDSD
jgi:hypothetical protein